MIREGYVRADGPAALEPAVQRVLNVTFIMSNFVDYGKRSVALPAGCKDLIDVLRLRERNAEPHLTKAVELGGLGDVETFIARQLQAAASFSNLLILWGSGVDNIQAALMDGVLNLFAIMRAKGPREAAVRAVFQHVGVALATGEPINALDAQTRVLRYQLPSNAGIAARLICDVLRRGYGVPEAARLEFYYVEG